MRQYIVDERLPNKLAYAYPRVELKVDNELMLYERFVPLLNTEKKKTTVRYGKDKIRIPGDAVLPAFMTRENDPDFKQSLCNLWVPTLVVKPLGMLTDEDGINDGFSGRDELVEVIEGIYKKFYGSVSHEDFVSIYTIHRI